MLRIGEFSKLSNITVRMLRHYDKLGLLVPQSVDGASGYRYYTAGQLKMAGKIQRLKELGFSLAVVKEMVGLGSDGQGVEQLKHFFAMRETELKDELARLETQGLLLESAVNLLEEDISQMDYHVSLKKVPARFVASARRVIASYMHEGELWQTLYAQIGQQKVRVADEPYGLAIFHDEEYKESEVDVEVQVAVQKLEEAPYQDCGDVVFKDVAAVEVACATLVGSYEQMGKVTAAVAQWMEDKGYRLGGPMFNIYHVSPAQDPDPEHWVTEVCFPVVKG